MEKNIENDPRNLPIIEKDNNISFMEDGVIVNAKDFIDKITQAMLSGEVDPLKGFTVIKRMAKISEEVLKNEEIKALASNELDKHLQGKAKSVNIYNATICKAATYTFYDFSECNDPRLIALYEAKAQVEHQIKLYEEELKLLIPSESKQASMNFGIASSSKDIVVESLAKLTFEPNGEIVTVNAPRKVQKMGMKFMKI